jgi:hypothetical protein
MEIDVMFNRPDRVIPLEDLTHDIHHAQDRIVLASAWFTNVEVAQAILESHARTKIVILSRGDLKRGDYQAYKRIDNDLHIKNRRHGSGLYILGSSSWDEGIMHHKFCLIDSHVVWTGSYNYTGHAKRNYETLLRIQSLHVNKAFWAETMILIGHEPYADDAIDQPSDGRFCEKCRRPVTQDEIVGWNSEGEVWCDECSVDPEEEIITCEQCHTLEAAEACCYEHGGGPICLRCCAQLHEH